MWNVFKGFEKYFVNLLSYLFKCSHSKILNYMKLINHIVCMIYFTTWMRTNWLSCYITCLLKPAWCYVLYLSWTRLTFLCMRNFGPLFLGNGVTSRYWAWLSTMYSMNNNTGKSWFNLKVAMAGVCSGFVLSNGSRAWTFNQGCKVSRRQKHRWNAL